MRAIGKLSGRRVKPMLPLPGLQPGPLSGACACAEARKGPPDAARHGWMGTRLV